MTTAPLSIDTAPRDPNELMKLTQGTLFRLGLQLEMFHDENMERAFLGSTMDVQAQTLAAALAQRDAGGTGRLDAMPQAPPQQPPMQQFAQQGMNMGQPQMGMPQMPTPQPQPQPQQPPFPAHQPMQQQQLPMGYPPQMGMPQMGMGAGMQQGFGPPMGGGMQLPQAMPPQAPQQPQMGFPMSGGVPPFGMPQVPPQAPQPQPRQPSTVSDPGPAAPPADPAPRAPKGTKSVDLTAVLKAVHESLEKHTKLLQETHETQLGVSRMVHTLLALQLLAAEQSGMKPEVLAKMVKNIGEQTAVDFMASLQQSSGGSGGSSGKAR